MKKLTAEKCREQFEEWFAKYKGAPVAEFPSSNMVEMFWQAWQASREALEIALPILEQQERGEGDWIEWGGGSRPVPLWQSIEVRLRSGNFRSGQTAAYWMWQHTGGINDIIAYRIIPERATNQNGEQ